MVGEGPRDYRARVNICEESDFTTCYVHLNKQTVDSFFRPAASVPVPVRVLGSYFVNPHPPVPAIHKTASDPCSESRAKYIPTRTRVRHIIFQPFHPNCTGYPRVPLCRQDSASGAIKGFSHRRRLSCLLMHSQWRGERTKRRRSGRETVASVLMRAYLETVGIDENHNKM